MPSFVRDHNDIVKVNAAEEMQRIEEIFKNQNQFSELTFEDKETYIKEYMYFQGKQNPEYTEDKDFKLYMEVKHGDAMSMQSNMVEALADSKNGQELLDELQSDLVKKYMTNYTFEGQSYKKKIDDYTKALKEGKGRELRLGWEEEAKQAEQAAKEKEERLAREREEKEREEARRLEQEEKNRIEKEKRDKELEEQRKEEEAKEKVAREKREAEEKVAREKREAEEKSAREKREAEEKIANEKYQKELKEYHKAQEEKYQQQKKQLEENMKKWAEEDAREKEAKAIREAKQAQEEKAFNDAQKLEREKEAVRIKEIEETLKSRKNGCYEDDFRLMEELLELRGRTDKEYNPKEHQGSLFLGCRRNNHLRKVLKEQVMEYADNGEQALELLDKDYIKLLAYGSGMNPLWEGRTTRSQRKEMREEFEKPIIKKLKNDYKNALLDKHIQKVAAISQRVKQLKNTNDAAEKLTTKEKQNQQKTELEKFEEELDKKVKADNRKKTSSEMSATIKSLEAAKVGVLWGSGAFDKSVDALKAVEQSCKKWLATQAVSPNPEVGKEEEAQIRKDIASARKQIDVYFKRKKDQGKMSADNQLTVKTDEKGAKRISILKEALNIIDKMEKNLDGKELEFPADVKSPADMIAPENSKHALKQMKKITDRGAEELSHFEKRTAQLGVASLVFEELLKTEAGEKYKKAETKEQFKAIIKKIADNKELQKLFPDKLTGDKVAELIKPESIKKFTEKVAKTMKPQQLEVKKKEPMFKK